MKRLVLVIVLVVLAWQAYSRYGRSSEVPEEIADGVMADNPSESIYSCDGRTHCSQMTSCAEAEYFLQNCPGVEMDGNNDGEPCESQWCGD